MISELDLADPTKPKGGPDGATKYKKFQKVGSEQFLMSKIEPCWGNVTKLLGCEGVPSPIAFTALILN